jgi:hypothetical protein
MKAGSLELCNELARSAGEIFVARGEGAPGWGRLNPGEKDSTNNTQSSGQERHRGIMNGAMWSGVNVLGFLPL